MGSLGKEKNRKFKVTNMGSFMSTDRRTDEGDYIFKKVRG